jgi:hypothetical protein
MQDKLCERRIESKNRDIETCVQVCFTYENNQKVHTEMCRFIIL